MAYIQDEKLRDGKGNLDTRCPHGMLYGISGSSYLIYTLKGTSIKRGADVTAPLDEEVLLARGLPQALKGEESDDVTQQLREDAKARGEADGEDMYDSGDEETSLDEPKPLPAITDPRGLALLGVVRELRAKQPGLSVKDAVTEVRKRSAAAKQNFPAKTKADAEDPTHAGPPSQRLRSNKQNVLVDAINAIAEAYNNVSQMVDMVDAAVYQLWGDEVHDAFTSTVSLNKGGTFESYSADVSKFVSENAPTELPERVAYAHECNKAARNFTEVVTDLGRAQLDVPASAREVYDSPFAQDWLRADQKSVDVVHYAGCPYIRLEDAKKQGYEIVPSVVQRKLKVTKATGRLAANDPRKSRTAMDGKWLKRTRERNGVDKPPPPRNAHVEIADELLLKMMLSEAAPEDEDISSADLPNAYNLAELPRPSKVLLLPETVDKWDSDGHELGLLMVVPHYGEEESGDDLDSMIVTELESAGFQRAEGVPALHTMVVGAEDGAKGGTVKLARIVDDFLIVTPKDHPVLGRIELHFRAAFGEGVKFDRGADEVAGITWRRDREQRLITVRMTQHVVAAAKRYYPGLLEGKRPSQNEAKGLKLHELCDKLELPAKRDSKLTRQQKQVQEITGALKFPEKVLVVLSLPLHRLARVGSFAPPEAYLAALLVLELAYDHRFDSLTYGPGEQRLGLSTRTHIDLDEPAPSELQGTADATWGLSKDVYGYIATRSGAAIMHGVKSVQVICESSYATEGVATQHLAQKLEYAQQIEQVFGSLSVRPTVIGTDSSSNLAVGSSKGAASSRSKHTLRRWVAVMKRMEAKQIYLAKVNTDDMPADFLTKFVGKVKLARSLKRATNSDKALPPK